jgi:hypothetical protein
VQGDVAEVLMVMRECRAHRTVVAMKVS